MDTQAHPRQSGNTLSNTDARAATFKERLVRLETERRDIAEGIKDIGTEMKSAHLLKEEIAGIKLAVKRHFETEGKRQFRETAEHFADSLGDFKNLPLGEAAVTAWKAN